MHMKKVKKWFKKYFIPHEYNEFKPHFLRHESMLFISMVIIVTELVFLTQVFIVFDKTSFLAEVLPGVLTALTNEERVQNDALPLTQNELLVKAAEMKANDMATNGYFAHNSPDGKSPWYWLSQVGYKYKMAGENLAVNFFESENVAQAWMNSPTHRANIVKKGYTEIGIGVANGMYEGRNTVFVAQFFGAPLAIIPSELAPKPETPVTAIKTTLKINPPIVKPTSEPVLEIIQPPVEVEEVSPSTKATAPSSTQILGEETNTVQSPNFQANTVSFFSKVLTSPRQYLAYFYGGILVLVLLAIAFALFIKSEIRHPAVLARGVVLVTIIIFLLVINLKILGIKTNTTQLPLGGLSASVIAY